ncbi:MAG: hypothetical protein RR063_09395 [Anaerovoracaceae bacterium]
MIEQYRIGIIDDDPSKITQMITMLRLCCNDEDGRSLKEKYANYELIPIELVLADSTDDMVERVIEERLDAAIIDYKLSSQQSISYTGVSLAKELHLRLWEFPIFVLTTYQDDLFDRELFDSYLVFAFDRYIEDDQERIELNSKLIEQIKKYRIEMANRKRELETLLPHAGESSSIDERILELDSQLEKSFDGRDAIPLPVKRDFTAERINELISKIDLLIEGE